MGEYTQRLNFLIAEDDPDDRVLIKEAFRENHVPESIHFVKDGVDLLDYLRRQDKYAKPGAAPAPDVILLDLNMPRKDGREALEEIKNDPHLRHIPVVVLTTSNAEEDIQHSYVLGAASYIIKPVKFSGLVDAIKRLMHYWMQVVRLPVNNS